MMSKPRAEGGGMAVFADNIIYRFRCDVLVVDKGGGVKISYNLAYVIDRLLLFQSHLSGANQGRSVRPR